MLKILIVLGAELQTVPPFSKCKSGAKALGYTSFLRTPKVCAFNMHTPLGVLLLVLSTRAPLTSLVIVLSCSHFGTILQVGEAAERRNFNATRQKVMWEADWRAVIYRGKFCILIVKTIHNTF